MKIKQHIVFAILFSFFYSCDENPELKTKIKMWEKKEHNYHLTKIEITKNIQPFYSRDSAEILKKELEKFIFHKRYELTQQLEDIKNRIERLKKHLESSESSLINKIIGDKIILLKEKKEKLFFIIDVYENHTEKTQIQVFQNSINQYLKIPDSVIGFTLEATLLKKQDTVPKRKTYFFDKRREIVCSYQ